jgi:uncharacterized protein (TIGR03437 family)
VDAQGAAILALATGAGLPLRNPMVAGPACSDRRSTSALVKLSPDGSALEFATYLDNCGVPGIAAAADGSIYAGVSSSQPNHPGSVLRLKIANSPAVSLDQIANAFSGDAKAVVYGGLYSITGSGFSTTYLDLGFNTDLPTKLGGVQVMFDGVPAAILQTSPGRLTVAPRTAPSPQRRSAMIHGFTRVQVFSNGAASNPVWMPLLGSLPGLLTRDYPDLRPAPEIADGNIRNEDGTVNDAAHPAATGSTIAVFVTGIRTDLTIDPAFVAPSLIRLTPAQPVYASWKRYSPMGTPAPENIYSVPGSTAALLQIRVRVPDSLGALGTALENGVRRVPLGLLFSITSSSAIPPVSNMVEVYVK